MGWFWADSPIAPNLRPPHPVSVLSATPPVRSYLLVVISRANARKAWLPHAYCRPLNLVDIAHQ